MLDGSECTRHLPPAVCCSGPNQQFAACRQLCAALAPTNNSPPAASCALLWPQPTTRQLCDALALTNNSPAVRCSGPNQQLASCRQLCAALAPTNNSQRQTDIKIHSKPRSSELPTRSHQCHTKNLRLPSKIKTLVTTSHNLVTLNFFWHTLFKSHMKHAVCWWRTWLRML